jgi:hypothetical protein
MKTIIGTAALAVAVFFSSTALAERPVSGAEAQRVLAGKHFQIQCVDGTYGRGMFGDQGTVSLSYKRFNDSSAAPPQHEKASVRARGNEICVAWKEFGGGGTGCYPVAEKNAGHYRIGSDLRWCEIKAKLN